MGEFPDLPPSFIELLHRQTQQRHWLQWQKELDVLAEGNSSAVSQ